MILVYWLLLFTALFLLAFLLPFDWWQKSPSRQRDKWIGRLLGDHLEVSLRNLSLRILVLFMYLFMAGILFFTLPLLLAPLVLVLVPFQLYRWIFKRPDAVREPILGIVLLALLAPILSLGLFALPRLLTVALYFLWGQPAGGALELFSVGKEMVRADSIIGILGICVVAFWLFLDAIWRLRQVRQIENLPTSKVRSAALGLVELKGVVRPLGRLPSEGEAVIRIHWDMFDYLKPQQWIEPFYLEDETGRVLVDARDCRVRAGWISEIFSVFGVREIVLARRIERDDRDDSVTRTLMPGDPIYLIGNAEMDAEARPNAADVDRVVVRPSARGTWNQALWEGLFGTLRPPHGRKAQNVFFLCDADEINAKRLILRGFRTVAFIGFLWLVSSLALIWTAQLPQRQEVNLEGWRNAYWVGPEPNPDLMVMDYTRNQRLFRFEKFIQKVQPGSAEAVPALLEAMEYLDRRFREGAIEGFLRLKPEIRIRARSEAIPILVKTLEYPDARILQLAIIALSGYGPRAKPALPVLVELLRCDSTNTYEVSPNIIRYQAAQALGSMGPAAREAVPALQEQLLHELSPGVRSEIEVALRRIEGSNGK